jgi:hypothetical protein
MTDQYALMKYREITRKKKIEINPFGLS